MLTAMTIHEWMDKYRGIMMDREESQRALEEFRALCRVRTPILYGYGMLGKGLGRILRQLRLFYLAVDRQGHNLHSPDGVHVFPPQGVLATAGPGLYFLVAAVHRLTAPSVIADLAGMNVPDDFRNPVSGHDLHITLQSAICSTSSEIDMRQCYECSILDNACPVLARYLREKSAEAPTTATTSAVKMIGYVLGDICNLNCWACCESIPLLPKSSKSFVPQDDVIADIKRYAAACEYLTLLEFIGGEPFLHPHLDAILTESLTLPNIGVIHVFTNGAVTPPKRLLAVLSNPRIVVYISRYSTALLQSVNDKIDRTVEMLKAAGVAFVHGSNANWYDMTHFDRQPDADDPVSLSDRFSRCFLHTCNRMSRGLLYRCPHHLSGVKLGKMDGSEVVHIQDGGKTDLVDRLEAFANAPYADACRYCTMPDNAPFNLVPGEQAGGVTTRAEMLGMKETKDGGK